MSRTYKKPYTKSKRFDSSCRNHGSCGYCVDTRTHPDRVRATIAKEKIEDFEKWEEAALETWARLDKH